MNRFEYLPAQLKEGEVFVARDTIVRIYDGDEKVRSWFLKFISVYIEFKFWGLNFDLNYFQYTESFKIF